MICLLCPRGCRLQVTAGQDGKLCVSGNSCPRGIGFAGQEWERPMRSLSSTVKTRSPVMPVLPVRVSAEIPLELVFEVMREINRFVLKRPVNTGEVLIENVCTLGVNVIATAPLTAEALSKDEEDTETEARLNAIQRGGLATEARREGAQEGKLEIQARREAGPGGKI